MYSKKRSAQKYLVVGQTYNPNMIDMKIHAFLKFWTLSLETHTVGEGRVGRGKKGSRGKGRKGSRRKGEGTSPHWFLHLVGNVEMFSLSLPVVPKNLR